MSEIKNCENANDLLNIIGNENPKLIVNELMLAYIMCIHERKTLFLDEFEKEK